MAQLMAMLKEFYPAYYKDRTPEQTQVAARLWYDLFAEHNGNAVLAAAKAFIVNDKKGFPPAPGQIMDYLHKINNINKESAEEAWNRYVIPALKNSAYGYNDEFEKLPAKIQRIVGSATVLRDWGMIETSQLNTVVKSNFLRSYEGSEREREEFEKLPANVKNFVTQIAGGMGVKRLEKSR